MKRNVLLDTGPLVAFLNRRDKFHEWAKAELARMAPPLHTCEAVLSEACFLVRSLEGGSQAVMELLRRGLLGIQFHLQEEVDSLTKLMSRYASVPMSLADACLVRMAELQAGSVILTLDRHLRIYRKHGRQVIPTIMPEDLG